MAKIAPAAGAVVRKVELAAVSSLKPHPRNYRRHPDDQLDHIIQSIQENGVYRNVVVAKDSTILAGHGIVQAAQKMGLQSIPVVRLDVDPLSVMGLKVLTGDNEVTHLGEVDDRLLTELLQEISTADIDSLVGTGYDEKMLANLVFVTRPEKEIPTQEAAAAWVGMPVFEPAAPTLLVYVHCATEEDRQAFCELVGNPPCRKQGSIVSFRWPKCPLDDRGSVKYE